MFYLEEHKNLEKNELYVYLANSFSKHQNLEKKNKKSYYAVILSVAIYLQKNT